jgi:hypothetical protein
LKIVQKYHPNVTKVVDGKKTLNFEVTAQDCKAGKRKGPSSCAMAKACERKYDGAIISLSVAYLITGNKATRYRVPSTVTREIVSFDRHKEFAPGEYHLVAPSSTEKLGVKREARDRPTRSYVRTVTRNHRTAGIRAL